MTIGSTYIFSWLHIDRFIADSPEAILATLRQQEKAIDDDVENLSKKQKVSRPHDRLVSLLCDCSHTRL